MCSLCSIVMDGIEEDGAIHRTVFTLKKVVVRGHWDLAAAAAAAAI